MNTPNINTNTKLKIYEGLFTLILFCICVKVIYHINVEIDSLFVKIILTISVSIIILATFFSFYTIIVNSKKKMHLDLLRATVVLGITAMLTIVIKFLINGSLI